MDSDTFDRLTRRYGDLRRFLLAGPSRRRLIRGLAALALSVGIANDPELTRAKKGKKTLKRNQFGCVNVGGKCRGQDQVCCSGICAGKKPKKGGKDKSRCVAHDETSCLAGNNIGLCSGENVACTTTTGHAGSCVTTTGNAGYCQGQAGCTACSTDADCHAICGPQAACAVCNPGYCLLVGIRTLCVGPNEEACSYPDIIEET
jgi:hypothetical protein